MEKETLFILMMVFGSVVLAVTGGVQILLWLMLRLELRKFERARESHVELEKMRAALAAVKLELSSVGDVVQTFSARNAVRSSRKRKEEAVQDEEEPLFASDVEFPSARK